MVPLTVRSSLSTCSPVIVLQFDIIRREAIGLRLEKLKRLRRQIVWLTEASGRESGPITANHTLLCDPEQNKPVAVRVERVGDDSPYFREVHQSPS